MSGRIGPVKQGTVTIGTQRWTQRNLDVATYRNGSTIPQITDPTQWAALTTGAWCYYDNDPANGEIYGKMYNWYAVNDPRGLAPVGYHVPSEAEYTILNNYLGGQSVAGGALKEIGITHWNSPNTGATNSSEWTGLPGGIRSQDGSFIVRGLTGYWWTSTANFTNNAVGYTLSYNNTNTGLNGSPNLIGFSVRLIKD